MTDVNKASGQEVAAIQVKISALSDMGRVRKNNEDNYVVCNLTSGEVGLPALSDYVQGARGTLFMVADGMGGEASGEVASQICTATVPKRIYDNLKSVGNVSEPNFVLLLREAIEYANQIIFQKAQTSPLYKGMGTTTTAAALFGPYLFVGQVGDSRAYLIRNKQMTQMTRDQTFLNYLADIGAELPADPEKDSRKSILTQAVGSSEKVEVKMTYTKVRQGDSLLICSDGLYNMVKMPEMTEIVSGSDGLPGKCKMLIAKANEHGGTDNCTVVIAEFNGPGLPPMDANAAVEFREFQEDDFTAGA
ncbi:MAG TPA: protein phosphatase 2C domain-containing protein [Terriglobia bacterium]|nr:protein phosphatase 2C domain-containing protein [Terriglobia bacterium]